MQKPYFESDKMNVEIFSLEDSKFQSSEFNFLNKHEFTELEHQNTYPITPSTDEEIKKHSESVVSTVDTDNYHFVESLNTDPSNSPKKFQEFSTDLDRIFADFDKEVSQVLSKKNIEDISTPDEPSNIEEITISLEDLGFITQDELDTTEQQTITENDTITNTNEEIIEEASFDTIQDLDDNKQDHYDDYYNDTDVSTTTSTHYEESKNEDTVDIIEEVSFDSIQDLDGNKQDHSDDYYNDTDVSPTTITHYEESKNEDTVDIIEEVSFDSIQDLDDNKQDHSDNYYNDTDTSPTTSTHYEESKKEDIADIIEEVSFDSIQDLDDNKQDHSDDYYNDTDVSPTTITHYEEPVKNIIVESYFDTIQDLEEQLHITDISSEDNNTKINTTYTNIIDEDISLKNLSIPQTYTPAPNLHVWETGDDNSQKHQDSLVPIIEESMDENIITNNVVTDTDNLEEISIEDIFQDIEKQMSTNNTTTNAVKKSEFKVLDDISINDIVLNDSYTEDEEEFIHISDIVMNDMCDEEDAKMDGVDIFGQTPSNSGISLELLQQLNNSIPTSSNSSFTSLSKYEVSELMKEIDNLLEFLPDEKIEELSKKEFYYNYIKFLDDLGI